MFSIIDSFGTKRSKPPSNLEVTNEKNRSCSLTINQMTIKLKKLEDLQKELEISTFSVEMWNALNEGKVIYYVCWKNSGFNFNWEGVEIE